MRSAAALSMDGVLLTPGCSNPLYRRAARVSMGTVFQIPWTYMGGGEGAGSAMAAAAVPEVGGPKVGAPTVGIVAGGVSAAYAREALALLEAEAARDRLEQCRGHLAQAIAMEEEKDV